MATLSLDELACLRGTASRFRLYLAVWSEWQVTQFSALGADPITGDPLPPIEFSDADFADIVVMGGHRLAFAGEPITVDASRSWSRGGSAGSAAAGVWTLTGANDESVAGAGPHEVTWSTPGLYQISYATPGAGVGNRWVRVVANRDVQPFDVVAIGSIAGGIDGGWTTEIVCAPTWSSAGNDPSVGARQFPQIADFQQIGIFCEEEWRVNGVWESRPIGGYTGDPRLLFSGYVLQGSIKFDASTNQVSFALGSLKDQMDACTIHRTSVWGAPQYAVYKTQYSDLVASDAPTKGGAILNLDKVTITDAIVWLLQANTSILLDHDFEAWYSADQQDWLNISSSEGPIWGTASSWAEAEFCWLWVDQHNGLHLQPNYHLRSINHYTGLHPIRMIVTGDDVLTISPNEDKSRNIIYVKLTGEVPARGKVFMATYPEGDEPPSGAGSWLTKDGVLISSKAFITAVAPRLYLDGNRRWTATLRLGQNRAIVPGDRLQLTLASFDHDIDWIAKEFLCRQVGYAIDSAGNTWTTTITVDEVIP